MDAAWNIGVWMRFTVDAVEGEPHHHVVRVEDLGSLVEQHALGQAGGAAGVHEHHRVGLLAFVGHDVGVAAASRSA